MAIAKRWAGRAWGTNVGNLFVKLEGEDADLTGTLRINEPGIGIAVYKVEGTFNDATLTLTGQPQEQIEGAELGDLSVTGTMNAKGEIRGDWHTTIESAGTFVLYPHADDERSNGEAPAEQLHTARFHFGAIEIQKDQITEIAENIGREFPSVTVSVVAGSEQVRYLAAFKQFQFTLNQAESVKLYASKTDGAGINQVVSIEFGPNGNTITTQGADESWVLGRLETLKRDLKRYERTYITSAKRWGIGFNQMMLLAAIVFLPSFDSLMDRMILMGVALTLVFVVNWLHSRYVPHAAIYLREKQKGWFAKTWPRFASWGIGIVATVIGGLVVVYLQSKLDMPAAPSNIERLEKP